MKLKAGIDITETDRDKYFFIKFNPEGK